jgi:hypothetical protein
MSASKSLLGSSKLAFCPAVCKISTGAPIEPHVRREASGDTDASFGLAYLQVTSLLSLLLFPLSLLLISTKLPFPGLPLFSRHIAAWWRRARRRVGCEVGTAARWV